jgi:hypothetical protein
MLRPRPMLTAPNQEWVIDFASDVAALSLIAKSTG